MRKGDTIHNISSCHYHQRAGWWWKSSIRPFLSRILQSAIHSSSSFTPEGRLVVGMLYERFSTQQARLHSRQLVTHGISSHFYHQKVG